MKILISGASGFLGHAFKERLETLHHSVFCLVRRTPQSSHEIFWDPERNVLDVNRLNGFDAFVHFSGAGIADKRWTPNRKLLIFKSRIRSTALLQKTITRLHTPPRVLLSSSAIGFYGSRGNEPLTEGSPKGDGFLARVCDRWEQHARMTDELSVRVVNPRFGIILGTQGGALKKMLLPFRLGLGGPLGDGSHVMSWIALPDALSALVHCLENVELHGPVNIVAPHPVTNSEFTTALGEQLRRPAKFPIPRAVLRLLFGELTDEVLLASARVLPQKLIESRFRYQFPELKQALAEILKI